MAATTKLIVYNDALRELGSHPLANLTSTNTRLQELEGAFNHAVEYILSRVDWNFARRRASINGFLDSSFPPYTRRYARPSDYLRKCWLKTDANDEFQLDHAEVGAVFYGFTTSVLLEYMSDHADNYDPANWPPQFTRCLVLYLAMLAGPKIGRTGDDDAKGWYQKLEMALADAQRIEAVYTVNAQVPSDRIPVIRRAVELIGQQLAGTTVINSRVDELRWAMNKSWTHSVKYVLEQAAWNFAAKRAAFISGTTGESTMPSTANGVIEGYSFGTASSEDTVTVSEFAYAHALPDDFLHKIWIKGDVNHDFECRHQRLGDYIFTDRDPCVMEYVSNDSYSTDPDNWPATFMEVVASYLALTVAPELVVDEGGKGGRIKAPQLRDKLEALYSRKLSDAKTKDAIQQEPKTIPLGRFARSRFGSIGTTSVRRYN